MMAPSQSRFLTTIVVAQAMIYALQSSDAFQPTTSFSSATSATRRSSYTTNASPFLHRATSSDDDKSTTLFFADTPDTKPAESKTQQTSEPVAVKSAKENEMEEILQDANDALTAVGWARPMDDGEMTSDDPFVMQIDESIQKEMGVGLDELLNPAKVVNLERDLFNLRTQLATATNQKLDEATLTTSTSLTTAQCDGGGGGEEADLLRKTISKKEKDLNVERRAVFRGWLKNVFLGQAVLSMALSWVMATNPEVLFGGFDWFKVQNMDTSIRVLGFWWWWLFIVPSLRSRRPTGLEKKALDIAFLGTPLISLLSPVVTKDTGIIWLANFAVVAGAYGFAYLGGEEEDDGADGEGSGGPGFLKFIYKSLDFGSGRERGARR